MKETVTDINKPFADVYKALDMKDQRKAMRSAMRREGNRLKKAAVSNLGQSGIPTAIVTPFARLLSAVFRAASMCVPTPIATAWASW